MTAATSTELPPMAKISLIGIWIETVLYGVNCVMYALCMFTLLCGVKTVGLRWVLLVVSTLFFLLCTVHVGASLQQLLDAFVYAPADIPNYYNTYWLNLTTTLRDLKDIVYSTLLFAQYFVLTWRLYVVYMCNWKVVVIPIVLALGGLGSIYASTSIEAFPNDNSSYSVTNTVVIKLIVAAWTCGFVHNLSVTGAMVVRLWWMGRTIASLTGIYTNRFTSTIYVIVESGAIIMVCGIVILALFASGSPLAFSSLDVTAQLCALIPLLIVVQVGKTGDSTKKMSRTLDSIRFRAVERSERDTITLDAQPDRSPSVTYDTHA